jgi:Fructosamine kinase
METVRPVLCHGDLWVGPSSYLSDIVRSTHFWWYRPEIQVPRRTVSRRYTTHHLTTGTTNQSKSMSPHHLKAQYPFQSLAIGRMFGGFSAAFYEEYHASRPKSKPVEDYDERVKLYKLFHYLNHTVLFGVSLCDVIPRFTI